MRSVSILGPPRTGRVVKTPEEALAECANQPPITGDPPVQIIEPDTTVKPSDLGLSSKSSKRVLTIIDEDTKLGDQFDFQSLTQTAKGDFVLHNLEVEEGKWDVLTLCADPIFRENNLLPLEWMALSNGDAEIYNGKYQETFGGRTPIPAERLAPMKVVYWFMRAGLITQLGTLDTDSNPKTSNALREFLKTPENGLCFHHADLFRNGIGLLKMQRYLSHHYCGLEKHLFDRQANAFSKNWSGTQYKIEENTPVSPLIGAILGDTNISRIKNVFSWLNPGVQEQTLIVPTPMGGEPIYATYRISPVLTAIHAGLPATYRGPARMMIADERYFTPRKVSP